ncbi:zf-HC2 domain-containing protein [bacterium]|nr:zf-HC2 domain-containing protein [bacterium]
MKCHHVRTLLPLCAGNDLDRFRSGAVRRHLASCPSCRKELEELQAARILAADAVRTRAAGVRDTDVWQDVVYALPRREMSVRPSPVKKAGALHRLIPIFIGTAMVVVALLFHEGGQLRRGSSPPHIAELPVVESVDEPGVTVMTFQTDDPKVTIVWLFKDDVNL